MLLMIGLGALQIEGYQIDRLQIGLPVGRQNPLDGVTKIIDPHRTLRPEPVDIYDPPCHGVLAGLP